MTSPRSDRTVVQPSQWLYCRACGWQADRPNMAMDPSCPDCGTHLWLMGFTPRDWMKYGSELLSGRIRLIELGVLIETRHGA